MCHLSLVGSTWLSLRRNYRHGDPLRGSPLYLRENIPGRPHQGPFLSSTPIAGGEAIFDTLPPSVSATIKGRGEDEISPLGITTHHTNQLVCASRTLSPSTSPHSERIQPVLPLSSHRAYIGLRTIYRGSIPPCMGNFDTYKLHITPDLHEYPTTFHCLLTAQEECYCTCDRAWFNDC